MLALLIGEWSLQSANRSLPLLDVQGDEELNVRVFCGELLQRCVTHMIVMVFAEVSKQYDVRGNRKNSLCDMTTASTIGMSSILQGA